MVQDELGATSIGSDATDKFKLKAVGDASIYELALTREVAAGLCKQLADALGVFEGVDEPDVGHPVDFEGGINLRTSPKV